MMSGRGEGCFKCVQSGHWDRDCRYGAPGGDRGGDHGFDRPRMGMNFGRGGRGRGQGIGRFHEQ